MTIVSFLLATALSAGVDQPIVTTSHAVPSAPVAGCSNCGSGMAVSGGAVSDCGCSSKPGFFDRFRGLFARKSHSDCGCAPAPAPVVHCAPAPVATSCGCGSPCGASDPCDNHGRSGLFSRFSWGGFKKRPSADCGCTSGCGSASGTVISSSPIAPAAPAYTGTPMPLPPVTQPVVVPEKPADIKKLPSSEDKKPPVEEKKLPKSLGSAPSNPTILPAAAKGVQGASNPFDLARRDGSRLAHAADYSTLTGQLQFVHADGGIWVLRYAHLSQEDANGGSVSLSRDSRMTNYREGDLVTVEGKITAKKGSSRLGAPLYRFQTISLVDRPQ